VQSIGAAAHPSRPGASSDPGHRFSITERDADCDYPDPGSIGTASLAATAALPGPERHHIPLKSRDYFEQLENVFFPL
jgi:hypothetical protein